MENQELLESIAELTKEIGKLPKGYISKKTIAGKVYYYHQWSEKGVKQSKYLRDDELEPLARQLEARKKLQEQLRRLKATTKTDKKEKKRNEVTNMKCTFMHKKIAVAEIELDDATRLYTENRRDLRTGASPCGHSDTPWCGRPYCL